MQPEWLIIELNEQGESASYPDIVASLKMVLGDDINFFVPMHYERMGSYISCSTLFQGYVFVKDTPKVRSQISCLRESRFFLGPLRILGKVRTVTSKEVVAMKRKLINSLRINFVVGSAVIVKSGIFKSLEGEVISLEQNGRIANVRIRCLSREIIAPVPTTCIEQAEHMDKSC
jgi:transcription antitermination factor NusG